MEFDIKELCPICNEDNHADIRIGDKQAVYRFDGEKWILMEVWKLVEAEDSSLGGLFDKIIMPDGPSDAPFPKRTFPTMAMINLSLREVI